MHVLGKVLLFFVFAGGVAALILTTKALDIRSQWMAKVQKLEKDYADNQTKLEKARAELQNVRAELGRTMLGWDRYWPKPPMAAITGGFTDPAKGLLGLTVGGGDGLQDKQVLHVFAVPAGGNPQYLGAFKVTTLRDNQSGLEPNWRIRPGDIPALPAGVNFRVRSLVPSAYQMAFDEREGQLAVADELIAGNTRNVGQQVAQLQAADEQLAQRLKEINGDPDLNGKDLPRESIEGLLKTIEEEEEARNAALKEGDRLRRELKRATDDFNGILDRNRKLAEEMKQQSVAPVGTAATPRSTVGVAAKPSRQTTAE